jgi:hypothetical protein
MIIILSNKTKQDLGRAQGVAHDTLFYCGEYLCKIISKSFDE